MSVLGAPDLVVLTLTEFAAQANRVCRAGNLALLCDADHGYGNALNVRRTVEELETAGICAMSIEDTVLPRPYGPNGKPTSTGWRRTGYGLPCKATRRSAPRCRRSTTR